MPHITKRPDESVLGPLTTSFTAEAENIYIVDPTSGTISVHLPTASGIGGLDIGLYVKYNGSNEVYVIPSGGETLSGGSGISLTQKQSVFLTSDGIDNWITWWGWDYKNYQQITLVSDNGTQYNLTVDDDGGLTTTAK